MLRPFGLEIVYEKQDNSSVFSLICNIIWALTIGLVLAIEHLVFGLMYCVTIIGIPFGLQHFKIARLAFTPFGATIR